MDEDSGIATLHHLNKYNSAQGNLFCFCLFSCTIAAEKILELVGGLGAMQLIRVNTSYLFCVTATATTSTQANACMCGCMGMCLCMNSLFRWLPLFATRQQLISFMDEPFQCGSYVPEMVAFVKASCELQDTLKAADISILAWWRKQGT